MSEKNISPEQKIQAQQSINDDKISTKENNAQVDIQKSSNEKQLLTDEQSATDKANQELAKLPQKIEDDLDEFNKTLKKLMGKNVSPKVDVNSSEFDMDAALGDLNNILKPLLGAISPIESVVGKVPVIGDLGGAITKITSAGDTGGLSKEEVKKLVPTPPDIPPSLNSKVQESLVTTQEFCSQLPMLLFKVIFKMLGAIYDMFDMISGVIGVPPPKFPFNLVKQMPTVVDLIQNFATSAPSQVKTIVEGKMKDMMATSQALAIPKPPSEMSSKNKETTEENKKEDKQEEQTIQQEIKQPDPPPEPSQPAPAESSIVDVPKIQPKPPIKTKPKYTEFIINLQFSGCDPKHTSIIIPKKDSKITLQKRLDDYLSQPIKDYKDIQEITKYSQYKYVSSSEMTTKEVIHVFPLYFDCGWSGEQYFRYGEHAYEVCRFVLYIPQNDNNVLIRYRQNVILINEDDEGDEDEDEDEEISIPDEIGYID